MDELDRIKSLNSELTQHLKRALATQQLLESCIQGASAMPKPTRARLVCSFCEKKNEEVKKLIAGPGVYICNECVGLNQEVLDKDLAAPSKEHALSSEQNQSEKSKSRCSFCGKQEWQVQRLLPGPGVNLCSECLGLCQEILAEPIEDSAEQNANSRSSNRQRVNIKRCSFCFKKGDEVAGLIVGAELNICTDCVRLCNELIKEHGEGSPNLVFP